MRYLTAALATVVLGAFNTADAQFLNRPEQQVEEWYQNYLGRSADATGLRNWGGQLRRGVRPTLVLAGILGSQEYYDDKGASPRRFVIGLHRDLLGRYPTPAELQNAVTLMGRGLRRAEIARRLLEARINLAVDPLGPPLFLGP